MPEYPDVEVYVEALRARLKGQALSGIRLKSPFLLRSVIPPYTAAFGRRAVGARRLGKRVVIELEGAHFLVIHLMIAGRLHWRLPQAGIPGRYGLAAFDFESGSMIMTEAGSKKRASLHVVEGEEALAELDPGGLEVFEIDATAFAEALRKRNHTLKRALTDPRIFAGIGNAYSDEILHRARLSPFKRSKDIDSADGERLFQTVRSVLSEWTDRLRQGAGSEFPERVTAFRPEMAVHGRYKKPCPDCGSPVQRIVYASNEANYCALCQTGGKVLADRALSRLLKDDWPRTLEELEALRRR